MFSLIFNQLLKMLIILIIGILCVKLKLVNEGGQKSMSNLLLMIVNPAVAVTVYQREYDPEMTRGLLLAFALAIASQFIGVLVIRLLNLRRRSADVNLEKYAALYSNCGFIGIPLVNSVLGSEGVLYLTAYMTVFNILVWTHGLTLLKGSFNLKNLKEGLSSPMVIGTVLGLVLYFARISIPSTLLDTLNYIADMNTPLAMLVAGFSVAGSNLKQVCTNPGIYLVSLQKLIIYPLVVLAMLAVLPVSSTIAYTTLIAAACPTATTLTMMTIRYDLNSTYASEIFSFTTVLSVVSIPIIMFIAGYVL